MTNFLVQAVDDRLAAGTNFVDIAIEIEDPAQRLLGRADIVTLRGEYEGRASGDR